jgi:hypothetical protein
MQMRVIAAGFHLFAALTVVKWTYNVYTDAKNIAINPTHNVM